MSEPFDSDRDALEAQGPDSLRRIAVIAYNNPINDCRCANRGDVTGGGHCRTCNTYLHGMLCRPGCACSPEIWGELRESTKVWFGGESGSFANIPEILNARAKAVR